MIFIQRTSPPHTFTEKALPATNELRSIIEANDDLFHFFQKKMQIWKSVRSELEEMFHRKCCYCETRFGPGALSDVMHHRPKAGVKEQDGRFPYHYSWLAFDWSNLLVSCQICNRGKQGKFPIDGVRSPVGAVGYELFKENPRLIDPCQDHPSDHLEFTEDGHVRHKTDRGASTIELLKLNRASLVSARRSKANAIMRLIEIIRKIDTEERKIAASLLTELREALDDSAEYAALARNLAETYLEGLLISMGYSDLTAFRLSETTESEDERAVGSAFAQLEELSLTDVKERQADTRVKYIARVRRIEWIQVKNIKALSDIRIEIPSANVADQTVSESDPITPWTMVLGENATGKSTLLKILSLALVGEEYRDRLKESAAKYVRQGRQSGWIKIKLSGDRRPITLNVSGDGFGTERAPILMLAYGSTLILQEPSASTALASYARIDNLFNALAPLINVNQWLQDLRSKAPDKFDEAKRALGHVLLFEGNEQVFYDLDTEPPELRIRIKDAVVGIDQLSDGYRTILTLTADIMSVLLEMWPTVGRAEGVVLIDELGNHLHPRWKMQLVTRLRETFPKVQFITTTHDPLCLRGLNDGEVVVLRRSARGHVVAVTDLPPVKSMRVDQLLTSEHFGLSSTQDPESEQFFRQYYRLLAMRRRTPANESALQSMRGELPKYGVVGKTRRERLMLEAIDFYLATERDFAGQEQRRSSQEALTQVLARILGDDSQ